jgi:hypothetical protein
MTRKRYRQGLAALTLLAAFFLLLAALLFAPTFAAVGNDGANTHQQKPGQSHHPRKLSTNSSDGAYDAPADWKVADKGHWNAEGGTTDHCVGLDCYDLSGGDISYGGDDKHAGSVGGGNSQGDQGSSNPYLPFIAGGGFGGNGGGRGAGGQNNPQADNAGKQDDNSQGDDQNGDEHHRDDPKGNPPNQKFSPDDPEYPPVDPNACPFADNCTDGPQPDPRLNPTLPSNEVPEPLTLSIFAAGLAGSVALRRRFKAR